MTIVTQKSRAKLSRHELANFIFNYIFDSNRADKLDAIVIAKDYLGYSESEIGKKLGISQPAVSKYYKEHKEKL